MEKRCFAVNNGTLIDRIAAKEVSIGVIGLGYVGLQISMAFASANFDVNGFDINKRRVSQLQEGNSYIDDISDSDVEQSLHSRFEPSKEPEGVAVCDIYIIAVPTGIGDNGPDMDAVKAAAETIIEQAPDREILVVVSSTVYPGATREVVSPIVTVERDSPTYLAMVPERLNPGGEYTFEEIPVVVGADSTVGREAAVELFNHVVKSTYPVDSTVTAELAKTIENTYRMVNIALVNELVPLVEKLEGDIWDAIDAAGTKPFGFESFYPGPGVGGHCIPVDPQFLTWRADELGGDLTFVEDAHRVNERMPKLVVDRLLTMLTARGVTSPASIVLLGAAYKPNVGDTRNSPALEVADGLAEANDVIIVDPLVEPEKVGHPVVRSIEETALAEADAVVLLVDHDAFDFHSVGNVASFVFDTRNVMPEDVEADVVQLGEI